MAQATPPEDRFLKLMLSRIIARCSVAMTNRQVMREAIRHLRYGWRSFKQLPRETRRKFLRICIECHEENKALYRQVAQGRF